MYDLRITAMVVLIKTPVFLTYSVVYLCVLIENQKFYFQFYIQQVSMCLLSKHSLYPFSFSGFFFPFYILVNLKLLSKHVFILIFGTRTFLGLITVLFICQNEDSNLLF